MKRTNVLLSLLAVVLFSCTDETTTPIVPPAADQTQAVRFHLKQQFDVEPFPEGKSMPGNIPSEPTSKADEEEEDQKPVFRFIEYAVYDTMGDKLVRHIQFSAEDTSIDDFGTYIYDTLAVGTYKVCLLTHSVEGTVFNDNRIGFNSIGDTFYGAATFDININEAGKEKEVVLYRMVSCVEFVATDTVPEKVNSFHIQLSERYNAINLLTGEIAKEASGINHAHTFTAAERGSTVYNQHRLFTLVPAGDDVKIPEINLEAKDADGNGVKKRTLAEVPIVRNRVTRYTGILYTPGSIDDRFDLTFDKKGEWDSPIEETLPDN